MLKDELRDFPGGPMANTPRFQCKRPVLDFWSGNQNPYAATKSSHKNLNTIHGSIIHEQPKSKNN